MAGMDWTALRLSLLLGIVTVIVLLPLGAWLGRLFAYRRFRGRALAEALVALPLVLPPTVLGFYLLVAFAPDTLPGRVFQAIAGRTLAFSFEGLVLASAIANLPFAVQPAQNGFAAVPRALREAAACAGLSPWRAFWRVELPLAWPGLLTGAILTFAHTLGEFGVVLMVGGSIPGETRTLAISIYDRVQALDEAAAGLMAAVLLVVALAALVLTTLLARRREGARDD